MSSPSEVIKHTAATFTNSMERIEGNGVSRVGVTIGSGITPMVIDLLDKNITKDFPHLLLALFAATAAYAILGVARVIRISSELNKVRKV